jgi:hypothetical protein
MLILVSVMMAVNALLVLLASSFGALFFESNRLQASADEIALIGARKLNENDRIGQINSMVARSRQLVFASRESYSEVDASYIHLRNLAQQLLDEARDGATTLEHERQQLRSLARQEATDAMLAKFNEIKNTYPLSLPWVRVSAAQMNLADIKLGKLSGVQSNVSALTGYDELVSFDHSCGHLQSYSDVELYKDHIDARLPGSDADLNFKLSSLPAPVGDAGSNANQQTAPARAVLASKFAAVDADEIPSLCQVKLHLSVATALGANGSGNAIATGTACAAGGQPVN